MEGSYGAAIAWLHGILERAPAETPGAKARAGQTGAAPASGAGPADAADEWDGPAPHVCTLMDAVMEMQLDALRALLPQIHAEQKAMRLSCPSLDGCPGYLLGGVLFQSSEAQKASLFLWPSHNTDCARR